MSALDFVNNLGLTPDPDDPPQGQQNTSSSQTAQPTQSIDPSPSTGEEINISNGLLQQEDPSKKVAIPIPKQVIPPPQVTNPTDPNDPHVSSPNPSGSTTTTVTPTPEQSRAGITGNPHVSDGSTIPHEQYLAAEQIALQSEKPKVEVANWIKNKKLAQELIDKGINADWGILGRAAYDRMQYKKDHQTMPATPGEQGYYKGYTDDDFRNALGGEEGWKKFFGLDKVDFNSPEGRKAIENALISKFGIGYEGLMADQKFGPFHLDFIMQELMKDPGEGEQPRPNDPGRPQDPNRPERPNGEIPDLKFYYENGYNPLMAFFDRKRPISDERIRRAAAAAATTEAMQSLAQMIVGENAPVRKNENTVTPKLIERLQTVLDRERDRDDTDVKDKRDAVMRFLDMAYKERETDKDRPESMFKTDLDQWNKDRIISDDRYNKDRDVSDSRFENDRNFTMKKDQFDRNMDWDREKTNTEIAARKQMQQQQLAHENAMLQKRIEAGIYENRKKGTKPLKPNVPAKGEDGKINPAAMTDDLVTQVNSYIMSEMQSDPEFMVEVKTYEKMAASKMPAKELQKAIAAKYFDRYMDINDNGEIIPKNGGSTGSWTGWNSGSEGGSDQSQQTESESMWDE